MNTTGCRKRRHYSPKVRRITNKIQRHTPKRQLRKGRPIRSRGQSKRDNIHRRIKNGKSRGSKRGSAKGPEGNTHKHSKTKLGLHNISSGTIRDKYGNEMDTKPKREHLRLRDKYVFQLHCHFMLLDISDGCVVCSPL